MINCSFTRFGVIVDVRSNVADRLIHESSRRCVTRVFTFSLTDTRCPYVTDRCKEGQPVDTKVKSRHHVWCFKVEEEMKQEG